MECFFTAIEINKHEEQISMEKHQNISSIVKDSLAQQMVFVSVRQLSS